MPFDLATFEAEVTLKLIPTDRLPAVAQDAMESGFDGPNIVRMAILEPVDGWAIDQALPAMLAEIGCHALSLKEAALRLSRKRAQRILESGEDPLPSLPYFYRLTQSAEYPIELDKVGLLEDDCDFSLEDDIEGRRTQAREALKNLLPPELREQK